MNHFIIKTAVIVNILSLLAFHSGISNTGHGAGAIVVIAFLVLVWLVGNTILIYYLALTKEQIIKSKVDLITLMFCTPLPLVLYFFIFF